MISGQGDGVEVVQHLWEEKAGNRRRRRKVKDGFRPMSVLVKKEVRGEEPRSGY